MTHHITDTVSFKHGASVKGRMVQAPMATYSGDEGGFVSEDTLKYYQARSQSAGLIIVEYTAVSETGGPCSPPSYPDQLAVYSEAHKEGLTQLARTLKRNGSKVLLQIHHGGRRATKRAASGKEILAPSPIKAVTNGYAAREMTDGEILEIVDDFGRATKRAIECGFDGVEIHGANHYLLQQFFSAYSNQRTDHWGGNLEKRMNFPIAVTEAVTLAAKEFGPDDFIIGYRISPEEIYPDTVGYTYHESLQLIEKLDTLFELDYFHLSQVSKAGRKGFQSTPADSTSSLTIAEMVGNTLKAETKLIIVGNITSEDDVVEALNYADLAAIGHGILIDPQFGLKIMEGRGDEIVTEMTEAQLAVSQLTLGHIEIFSVEKSITGLPPIKGWESLSNLHQGW